MESPVQRLQFSQTAKDQLIKLKRVTKIDQWNILCRWALCRSLAEDYAPADVPIPSDSNLEMSWQTFGGEFCEILLIALIQWCIDHNLPPNKETLARQLRLHVHRGIGYLAGDPNLKAIEHLVNIPVKNTSN
jgi:DNA sulfur modification protein DndE